MGPGTGNILLLSKNKGIQRIFNEATILDILEFKNYNKNRSRQEINH